MKIDLPDNYYWCRHSDGTKFIVLVEDKRVYGPLAPVTNLTEDQIICPVRPPQN